MFGLDGEAYKEDAVFRAQKWYTDGQKYNF